MIRSAVVVGSFAASAACVLLWVASWLVGGFGYDGGSPSGYQYGLHFFDSKASLSFRHYSWFSTSPPALRARTRADNERVELRVSGAGFWGWAERSRWHDLPMHGGVMITTHNKAEFSVPLWMPLLFFVCVGGALCIHPIQHDRGKRGLCVKCAYDLTGNTSGVCPECGRKIEPVRRGLGGVPILVLATLMVLIVLWNVWRHESGFTVVRYPPLPVLRDTTTPTAHR